MIKKIFLNSLRFITFISICILLIQYFEDIKNVEAEDEIQCIRAVPEIGSAKIDRSGNCGNATIRILGEWDYCALSRIYFFSDDDCNDFDYVAYVPDPENEPRVWFLHYYGSGDGCQDTRVSATCMSWGGALIP